MAEALEKTDSASDLLKNLTASFFKDEPDIAIRMFKIISRLLLSRATYESSSSSPNSSLLRADNFEVETLLKDKRLIRNYIEETSPEDAEKFAVLCEKIERDVEGPLKNRVASLRLIMQLAKKANSDEPILDKKLRVATLSSFVRESPRVKAECNADINGTDFSRPSSTGSAKSLSTSNIAMKESPRITMQPQSPRPISFRDSNNAIDVGGGLSERELLQGLLFVWHGIPGKIFRLDETSRQYILHEKWDVYPWVREQANNLATLGFLHDLLVPYSQAKPDVGRVRCCVAGFVRDQLSDYYALIASLRTQEETAAKDVKSRNRLSLESLRVQSQLVGRTLADLISILEFTSEDRGGYLASGVYAYIYHGDPQIQSLAKRFLAEICQPLYGMLTKWVLEGSLCDSAREFFVAVDNRVASERLWIEKYSLREQMLPEFISPALAEKVLSVGRSLNFLRETCNDIQPFAERQKIKERFQYHSAEVMYLIEQREIIEELIDEAYQVTNKRVLEILLTKYSMLDHFQAHRKFLLLGQGDFIHHLMDLLMDVLSQPADQLHPHYLNGVLEGAIRATTAQFEPEDILNRLDAATLQTSSGDIGWDVFYLRYHVDGPIGTVFSSASDSYQLLFYALWRAKRIEMVLSKSWKHQITAAKALRRIGEMRAVSKQCHELTAEMVHFVRQTQYYFLFEVLECAWNQLIDDIQHAESLEHVIKAHQHFLNVAINGVFKSSNNTKLNSQLRMVYELALELVEQVDGILLEGEKEAKERSSLKAHAKVVSDSGKLEYLKRRRDFVAKYIPEASAKLKNLGRTYRDTIKKLILMLNSEPDLNLQLLSIRLDFNEFYKKIDSSLEAPLTFQHRRVSSIGFGELSPILTRKLTPKDRKK